MDTAFRMSINIILSTISIKARDACRKLFDIFFANFSFLWFQQKKLAYCNSLCRSDVAVSQQLSLFLPLTFASQVYKQRNLFEHREAAGFTVALFCNFSFRILLLWWQQEKKRFALYTPLNRTSGLCKSMCLSAPILQTHGVWYQQINARKKRWIETENKIQKKGKMKKGRKIHGKEKKTVENKTDRLCGFVLFE